jgi:hypothetical protein
MNKNILRLGFSDTFQLTKDYFTELLSEDYQVIRDDINPDYLIFGDKNFGTNNTSYDNRNCIKIFYTGENARPWDYRCHYSISFDHHEFDGRNYRLPLYVLYETSYASKNNPSIQNTRRSISDLIELDNKGFCSFVVTNPMCKMRNDWFHKLSAYRQVSSGGSHYNNIGYILSREDDGPKVKYDFLSNHKFSLCFENSSYPGYTTEKLYESLCARTIPIYWGSPTVDTDFNPKAFLNWHDYGNDDEFFEVIVTIDKNPDLYEEMYMQSMFVNDNNISNKYMDRRRFLNWFSNNVYKGVINNV